MDDQQKPHDPTTMRQFSQIIVECEDGQFNADLSDALRDLIGDLHNAAVSANGRAKGNMTVKIDFKLDGGVMTLTTDYSTKAPKAARAHSVFWATPENNLSRRNPKQRELELRTVSEGPREIRNV
ncbi:hypothetical protein [Acetobacter persici]|uniref:hypothetical protein n=1 Tax=Acetobacter persici TaxID=1076596 RepID=UPI001BA734B0|nr:hypothetical protein [Acetobacter persici]MBS1014459.1 hypothetical protein [Acetobacter persici]